MRFRPTPVDAYIETVLTPAILERTAELVAELEPVNLPNGFDPAALTGLHSTTQWFGSTAGPFGGVGCAAMTLFRLSVVYSKQIMFLFANDRFYGVAGYRPELLLEPNHEDFLRIPCNRPGIPRISQQNHPI